MLVTVFDIDNELHKIRYKRLEYPNLMELMANSYYTEIGECKGRGLCCTCAIEILKGFHLKNMGHQEKHTLQINGLNLNKHRLACQIILDESINGASFKELGPL